MDRYTAAALQANIASMGDAFMQMNDPSNAARARLLRSQEAGQGLENQGISIKNSFLPGLSRAQMAQDNAAATAHLASAGLANSQTANWNIRNDAGKQLMHPPLTTYSQGAAVGGKDEMQDSWTNKGFTSTGQNLSPGVVAVGSKEQIGNVYRDQNGRSYIAADRHGNADKATVDIYQPGESYNPAAVAGLQLQQVGKENITYGTTSDQLAALRAKYERDNTLSNVFGGGGAADLATAQGRSAALTAPDEMSMRRAMGAQGQVMGQGEYFDPASSNAFQDRALAGPSNQKLMEEENANLRKSAEIIAGGGSGIGSSASAGGVAGRNPLDAVNGVELTQSLATQRFGMAGEGGTVIVSTEMQPYAIAWQSTVAQLTEKGVPIQTAIGIADQHHNVNALKQSGNGWFDGDPRMEAGGDFNPASMTPDEASGYSIGSTFQPAGQGAGGERMFAAGMLNPQLAQMAGQAQQAPEIAAPAMIPPLLQRQPDPVPQTGPAGKALGSEKEKAEKQKGMDAGTDYNAGTLGNAIRAAEAEGVSIGDLFATASANTPGNDAELDRIFATSKGLGVLGPGGRRAADLRNALKDSRALQRANINPAQLAAPQAAPQTAVRRFNPTTGRIE